MSSFAATAKSYADRMMRRRVIVSGDVQGVFFRDGCRREAERLGVNGWVRNVEDGSVEAAFEGDERAVDAMVSWCGRGTEQARIDRVESFVEEPEGDRGFTVR